MGLERNQQPGWATGHRARTEDAGRRTRWGDWKGGGKRGLGNPPKLGGSKEGCSGKALQGREVENIGGGVYIKFGREQNLGEMWG